MLHARLPALRDGPAHEQLIAERALWHSKGEHRPSIQASQRSSGVRGLSSYETPKQGIGSGHISHLGPAPAAPCSFPGVGKFGLPVVFHSASPGICLPVVSTPALPGTCLPVVFTPRRPGFVCRFHSRTTRDLFARCFHSGPPGLCLPVVFTPPRRSIGSSVPTRTGDRWGPSVGTRDSPTRQVWNGSHATFPTTRLRPAAPSPGSSGCER